MENDKKLVKRECPFCGNITEHRILFDFRLNVKELYECTSCNAPKKLFSLNKKGTLHPKTISELTGQVLRDLPVRREQ